MQETITDNQTGRRKQQTPYMKLDKNSGSLGIVVIFLKSPEGIAEALCHKDEHDVTDQRVWFDLLILHGIRELHHKYFKYLH